MHTLLSKLAAIAISPTLFFLGAAGYHVLTDAQLTQLEALSAIQHEGIQTPPQLYGAFNPTGGLTYRLFSSIGSADTSITLTSFKEPVSNIPYTMSYLNSSVEYGTIAPLTTNSEFISFTGITQNSDGTATITGIVRGLARTPGSGSCLTASTTLEVAHPAQTGFIISNSPCFQNEYAVKQNAQSITGVWTFASTSAPVYDADPGAAFFTTAPGTTLINLAQLQRQVFAGAANASEIVAGLVELATGREAASSTSIGGTGARLVLPASLATSTPAGNATTTVVVTQLDGKINPLFIATSSAYTYTWNASTTFAGLLNLLGTTSIAANVALGKGLCLNGVCYTAPATQGSAGNVLQNNGSGTLSWGTTPRYSSIGSTFNIGAGVAGFGTSTGITIPAGVLTSSSTIEVHGNFNSTNGAGSAHAGTIFLRTSNGVTLGSCGWSIPANLGVQGMYFITVSATSTTASQQTLFEAMFIQTVGTISSSAQQACDGVSYTGLNFSQAQTLVLVVQSNDTNGNNTILGNSQFVVNP